MANHGEEQNLYDLLEVSPKATSEEIRQAYVRLAKKYHPDKNNNSKKSGERFKRINNAYDILSDRQKRHEYDRRCHSLNAPSNVDWPFHDDDDDDDESDNIMQFALCSMLRPRQLIRRCFGLEIANLFDFPDDNFGIMSSRRQRHNEDYYSTNDIHRKVPRFDDEQRNSVFTRKLQRVIRRVEDPSGNLITEEQVKTQHGNQQMIKSKLSKRIGGKLIETLKSVTPDGIETVTIIENGILKSKKVNGKEQITLDDNHIAKSYPTEK